TDDDVVAIAMDALQAGDPMEIDQMPGGGEPQLHHGDQAVTAGDRAGILAECRQQPYRIGHTRRPVIAECTSNHRLLPPSLLRTLDDRLAPDGLNRNASGTQGAKFARDAASLTRSAAVKLTYQEYGDKVGRTACPLRLAIPRRALTSAILARLTGTR